MLVSTSQLLHNYQSYWVEIGAVKSMLYMDCLKRVKHPLMANILKKTRVAPPTFMSLWHQRVCHRRTWRMSIICLVTFSISESLKWRYVSKVSNRIFQKKENCNFWYDSCWRRWEFVSPPLYITVSAHILVCSYNFEIMMRYYCIILYRTCIRYTVSNSHWDEMGSN